MKLFLLLLSIQLTSNAQAMTGAMVGAVGGTIKDTCLELHSNWLSAYSTVSGHWKFNGLLGNIANSTTILKANTGGIDGTASNANGTGLSYIQGQLDQAIKFDGVDDYIMMDTNLAKQAIYTVMLWVKPGTVNASRSLFAHADSGGCFYNPAININSSTGAIVIAESGCGGSGTIASATISTTAWTHLAVTKNGTTAKAYVNGALIATNSSLPAFGNYNGKVLVGASYASGSGIISFSDVSIDEVAVWWGTELTGANILSIYQHQACN